MVILFALGSLVGLAWAYLGPTREDPERGRWFKPTLWTVLAASVVISAYGGFVVSRDVSALEDARLQHGIDAALAFGRRGTFEGITPSALSAIEPNYPFVDGALQHEAIAIRDAKEESVVIVTRSSVRGSLCAVVSFGPDGSPDVRYGNDDADTAEECT